MRWKFSPKAMLIAAGLFVLLPAGAGAQLTLPNPSLPSPSLPSPPVPAPKTDPLAGFDDPIVQERLAGLPSKVQRRALRLLENREKAVRQLLRQHGDLVERDNAGNLARRGELLAMDAAPQQLAKLSAAGFSIVGTEPIDGLDIAVTRLALPKGVSLSEAQNLASSMVPQLELTPDNLHFQSASTATPLGVMQAGSASVSATVGMIDGAPSKAVSVGAVRGFAKGAPLASHHGTAIASLLKSAGVARIRVADVYGSDPAGGNALAIAKGIGWLVQNGSRVITISLVGPRNSLLQRAIASAQRKGAVIVAAVGNDGPAAPPAYPASYKGVVAVTGVDKKGRALIEAGRALNLDYAAPGADIYGYNKKGKRVKWRGTSFATPLVAARLAAARSRTKNWRSVLDKEARDLGAKGPDKTYGRGLLCGRCARKK